jgi:hypothetical protein
VLHLCERVGRERLWAGDAIHQPADSAVEP